MSKRPLFAVIAALLCAAPPANAQQARADFPDGPGKQTFVNFCGGCHDINRVRAGYTPRAGTPSCA
jgi:virginiamycin B lyase